LRLSRELSPPEEPLKRRDFLASAAALSLFSTEALAAKKKSASKTAAKSTSKKPKSSQSGAKSAAASSSSGVHTANDPITEKPPQGTSATRLPPVKAEEPPATWQTYEIATVVTVKGATGQTSLWLPLPLNQDTLFQRTLGHSWDGNPKLSSMRRLPDGDLEVFHSEWSDGSEAHFQIKTVVTTADRHFDITKRSIAPERDDILRRNLQASQLIPNDGLAHQLGTRIVGRIKDPVAQTKAIYDWVVENTIYDAELPGCGNGDINRQLISGKYGGRSADINGLFVAICRAIGIPARCVFGLRVGPSRLFRSLGLTGEDATRAQHVRAEFYVPGFGWIPVDPSDVRRAIAMEGLSDQDSKLQSLRKILFGVWEMNWIAFNVGTDVELPGRQTKVPFLLLPQLEAQGTLRDGTNPTGFEYAIKARRRVEL